MLLVTDLDGTLLTSRKIIGPRTRQALADYRQRGGQLAACSARPVSSMMQLLQEQEVDTLFSWCAGFNGGQILAMAQQRIIHSAGLSSQQLQDIDRHSVLSRYSHHFFSAGAIYCRDDYPVARWTRYEARLFDLPLIAAPSENIVNRNDIYKITLVADSSKIDSLDAQLNIILPVDYRATVTGAHYIDIQRAEINKGYAIKTLIEQAGICAAQVIAFGDQQNDVSMFTAAGVGIAMGNAPASVKKQADYVTASNDDEGIADALKWLR